MEESAVVPPSQHSAAALRPLLEECGYTGSCLAAPYSAGDTTFPLVGFAGKPWDSRSACIAVVDGNGKPSAAAASCRELGAPIVWVRHNGRVDWWTQHDTAPSRFASKPVAEFRRLVREHKADLKPEEVYRLKTLGRLPGARQLDFVDAGLMPLLEARAGEQLGGLVEDMTRAVLRGLRLSDPGKKKIREVFTAVFRLLAGKILHDKRVRGFTNLALDDPGQVLQAVWRHYQAGDPAPVLERKWVSALSGACELIAGFGDVRVVSPETLAYVYEHTLVNEPLRKKESRRKKESLRKKLGIHATPPYLVDYILWQLYDWIREIPPADRHVFEAGSGHAPFLLAAMRMLRLEKQGDSDRTVHTYLKQHIHGVEIDDFAREIARLRLTLADIPNPNGWDLQPGDMYASNILAEQSRRCRILLSNPPYEKFEEADKRKCAAAGYPVRHFKAVELLDRTLKHLLPGAVFGVVVPQGVLNSSDAADIRRTLLRDFEIAEICRFPGKVFTFSEMETTIILGRRHSAPTPSNTARVRLRDVGEHGLAAFQDSYHTDRDTVALQGRFQQNPNLAFAVPALDDLWTYLLQYPRLSSYASVGRGIEYKSEKARGKVPAFVEPLSRLGDPPDYPAGYQAGYAVVTRTVPIYGLPPEKGIAVKDELIENSRQGKPTGNPQVLVNRNRTTRGAWRIKAFLDPEGRPIKNNFLVVRPTSTNVSAVYLWALLNSPVVNAFVGRDTMRRDNAESALASLPIPRKSDRGIQRVVDAAINYRGLFEGRAIALKAPTEDQVRGALLALDAELLRLYRLPVRLERQLLDYFKAETRGGVGCVFRRYFPVDFDSLVPLHKYVAVGYRNSTVDGVAARMKPGESDSVLRDLQTAADAFGGH